jgi:hypothetical protein
MLGSGIVKKEAGSRCPMLITISEKGKDLSAPPASSGGKMLDIRCILYTISKNM